LKLKESKIKKKTNKMGNPNPRANDYGGKLNQNA